MSEKSFKEYERDAKWGDRNAQAGLGWMYEKAARLEGSAAQLNLAWMYIEGLGVKQDHQKCVYWMKKAAEQGEREAIEFLSKIYN
jgi:TPR repeat protein